MMWIYFLILSAAFYHHFLSPIDKIMIKDLNSSIFQRYTTEHQFYIQDPIMIDIDNMGLLFF